MAGAHPGIGLDVGVQLADGQQEVEHAAPGHHAAARGAALPQLRVHALRENGQWTMDNGQWTRDNGQGTMDTRMSRHEQLRQDTSLWCRVARRLLWAGSAWAMRHAALLRSSCSVAEHRRRWHQDERAAERCQKDRIYIYIYIFRRDPCRMCSQCRHRVLTHLGACLGGGQRSEDAHVGAKHGGRGIDHLPARDVPHELAEDGVPAVGAEVSKDQLSIPARGQGIRFRV